MTKLKPFSIRVSQDIKHIWQLIFLDNAFHLIRIQMLVKNVEKDYLKFINQLKKTLIN